MITFTISVADLEDAVTLEQSGMVNAFVEWAEKAVRSGGKVVFQREYVNAVPDVVVEISTEEDLQAWAERVTDALRALRESKIDG